MDDAKILKESTNIFLGFCDEVLINSNIFDENYLLHSGDSYLGQNINLFKSMPFHGITVSDNLFKNHHGIPDIITSMFDDSYAWFENWATSLSTNPLISLNIWSEPNVANLVTACSITFHNLTFDKNDFHIADTLFPKYAKLSKFNLTMPTALTGLIKVYYPYDTRADTPNVLEIIQGICKSPTLTLDSINVLSHTNKDAVCSFDLMGMASLIV